MLRRVALLRTDVAEERIASFIRVKRIGGLGTKLAVTGNRNTLRYVPPKSRFLQEPRGVTSQTTAFFIVTGVKSSNLTFSYGIGPLTRDLPACSMVPEPLCHRVPPHTVPML
jgi:hypothetical protein